MKQQGVYHARKRNVNILFAALSLLVVILIAMGILWVFSGLISAFAAILLLLVAFNLYHNRKMVAIMRELGVSDMDIERFEAEHARNGKALLKNRVLLSDNYVMFHARQAYGQPVMFAPFIVLPLRELTRVHSCTKKVAVNQYGQQADVHALEFAFGGNVFRLTCTNPAQAASATDAMVRRKKREDDFS